MASGNHTWSGNWALLPQAPSISNKQIAVAMAATHIGSGPRGKSLSTKQPGNHGAVSSYRIVKVERPIGRPDQEHPQGKAEVTNPIDQEGLLAGSRGLRFLVPEADQKVAAEPDSLPENVEQHKIAHRDKHRHGEDEQPDVAEEPPIAGVIVHVADRINRHQQRTRTSPWPA